MAPKRSSGPTWALLPPSNLPDAEARQQILGAIIPDYEQPLKNGVPEDASKVIQGSWLAKPTEDGGFRVALSRARNESSWARLGDILRVAFHKNSENEMHLSSTLVRTYAVTQEIKAFKKIEEEHKAEILELINGAPSRNKGAVFQIVAIKTCRDADISVKGSTSKGAKVASQLPVKEAAAALGAPPIPIITNPEAGHSRNETAEREESQIAKGERIFAVQYRLIRKQSDWIKIGSPKMPEDLTSKDYFVPDGPAMYGRKEDDGTDGGKDIEEDTEGGLEEEDEDEDEDEDGDKDPIQLGDLEHTWSLWKPQEESSAEDVIMTEL